MKVEIWSDIVCPWCYIGKRRLESALSRFPHRGEVEVRWRSFELDPTAPRRHEGHPIERLAAKYGTGREEARAAYQHMTGVAAGEGLTFRLEQTLSGNTFDAHRLLHLAGERGCQDQVKERFFEAYLSDGQAIGDGATLVRLAAEAGLPAGETMPVLSGTAYAEDVRADEVEASQLGITGVPFFVLDRRYRVSGAQSAETLLDALDKAWRAAPGGAPARGDAGGCDGDSCAL